MRTMIDFKYIESVILGIEMEDDGQASVQWEVLQTANFVKSR